MWRDQPRTYGTSLSWHSQAAKERAAKSQLNEYRRKVCRKSPFWDWNFDLPKHRKEWEEGRKRIAEEKMVRELEAAEEARRRQDQDPHFIIPVHIRMAFDGKDFETHHSPVLFQETIFCPQWQKGKEVIAPWPGKQEMKYEGDDRISTDILHGRFPGVPRVEGNETVTWQYRAPIPQFAFDEFYYPIPHAVEIFLRSHRVPELEFSDTEGQQSLGKEMMEMLDPQDQ